MPETCKLARCKSSFCTISQWRAASHSPGLVAHPHFPGLDTVWRHAINGGVRHQDEDGEILAQDSINHNYVLGSCATKGRFRMTSKVEPRKFFL